MKLALYVHDFKLEIGHSNSLIELIRHLPQGAQNNIDEIEVVSFTTTPLKDLFPEFKGKLHWRRVPCEGLKPVLFKAIFFQIWCWFYNTFLQTGSPLKMGIGISSLDVDAVSIQFIHHQWTKAGLTMERAHPLRLWYKRILFAYFEACESVLFKNRKVKFFSPAKFLTDYLKTKNIVLETATIYSGVNLSRFILEKKSKNEVLSDLKQRYPELATLSIEQPIYLFVGAYERKGIDEALSLLSKQVPGAQFIVIGSSSSGRQVQWPTNLKIVRIPFTREVPKFYALSDCFLFPTIYEPFGLVLFEAMAMGLTIVTRRKDVGASELLEGLPEVYFCDRENFHLPFVGLKSQEDREDLRSQRLVQLGDVSWSKAGSELAKFLNL